MNNEPVAWMVGKDLCRKLHQAEIQSDFQGLPVVPLYDHQAKELDDDVIDALINDMPESPTNDELYEFARKVLRKEQ